MGRRSLCEYLASKTFKTASYLSMKAANLGCRPDLREEAGAERERERAPYTCHWHSAVPHSTGRRRESLHRVCLHTSPPDYPPSPPPPPPPPPLPFLSPPHSGWGCGPEPRQRWWSGVRSQGRGVALILHEKLSEASHWPLNAAHMHLAQKLWGQLYLIPTHTWWIGFCGEAPTKNCRQTLRCSQR